MVTGCVGFYFLLKKSKIYPAILKYFSIKFEWINIEIVVVWKMGTRNQYGE